MVSIEQRIARIEAAMNQRDPNRLQSVPEAWTLRNEQGDMVGPSPDDRPTPGELRSFAELQAIDATVPAFQEAGG